MRRASACGRSGPSPNVSPTGSAAATPKSRCPRFRWTSGPEVRGGRRCTPIRGAARSSGRASTWRWRSPSGSCSPFPTSRVRIATSWSPLSSPISARAGPRRSSNSADSSRPSSTSTPREGGPPSSTGSRNTSPAADRSQATFRASWPSGARTRHPAARRRQALRADHGRGRAGSGRADGYLRRPAGAQRSREVHDGAPAHGPVHCRRGGARLSAAAGAARRADGRARSTGAAGALGADRRAPFRGDDDPDVDPLHRGGSAPRRYGADHVARQVGGGRPAFEARGRTCRAKRDRGLWAAGTTRRGRGRGGSVRVSNAAHGDERFDPRRRRQRRLLDRRRPAPRQSRGRVRPAHRRGDRLMATTAAPRGARLGRLERPALTGVLVREVVNYSSYWKSSTFSSTVEPTIYLLAFGFGFGSLV